MAKDPETCAAHGPLGDAIDTIVAEHVLLKATVKTMAADIKAIRTNVCGSQNGTAVGLGEQVRDNAAAIATMQSQIGAVRSGAWQVLRSLITPALSAAGGALIAMWAWLRTGG